MIDISLPLKNGIITFPGDMPYEEYEFKTYRKDKVHITRVIMETHSGTHFDAPFHMIENGKKASEIDIERFIGKATVVEVRGDEIDAGDIPDNVEKNCTVQDKEFRHVFRVQDGLHLSQPCRRQETCCARCQGDPIVTG